MAKNTYKSYDDLPLMLSVMDVAALFGISRSHAYDLVHEKGFPVMELGGRIIVPKDALIKWIKAKTDTTEL